MAVTALSMILLAQQYNGGLIRQANRKAVTLSILRKTIGAGKNVTLPFELSGQGAAEYNEGADTSTFAQDGQAGGILNWGLYEAPVSITNLAVDASATTTAGPAGNEDVWGRQLYNGGTALVSLANQHLFTGTGSGTGSAPTIVGFGTALGSTSNTYAGLDRSSGTYALLRPTVTDPGSATALTVAQIRADLAAMYIAGGSRPDVALVKPAVFNKIAALIDPLRRMETETVQTVGGAVNLNFSVSTLRIDGCLFIEDKDAGLSGDSSSVGSIIYLNTEYVEIELLMPALNKSVYQSLVGKGMISATDGNTMLGMSIYFEPLAKTGSAFKGRGALTAQLKCLRPNAMGVRRNIDLT
jgi:hypothetical protein